MNIALCHFRVGETDGVSLEMDKWKKVLEELGHNVYLLAGSKGSHMECYIIPELHYRCEHNDRFVANSYDSLKDYSSCEELKKDITIYKDRIKKSLSRFIRNYHIDVLVPNNIWSLGWGIPAGLAFKEIASELGIRCVAHHHDFSWERERYTDPSCGFVREELQSSFPPSLDNISHVVINSLARDELKKRRDIESIVIPNVFDFNMDGWSIDDYNGDFREKVGLEPDDILVLQATRITERKAIELAIDMVATMNKLRDRLIGKSLYDGRSFKEKNKLCLVMTGLYEAEAGYLSTLIQRAEEKGVCLRIVNHMVDHTRAYNGYGKVYSLWDAYAQADIITYPSLLEGWGNQLLEGIFARKPIVAYEYPVFERDIKESGLEVISLGNSCNLDDNGLAWIEEITLYGAAEKCIRVLLDKDTRDRMVDNNFEIGRQLYSYDSLKLQLGELFNIET